MGEDEGEGDHQHDLDAGIAERLTHRGALARGEPRKIGHAETIQAMSAEREGAERAECGVPPDRLA